MQCDNQGVCSVINSGKSRHPFMQAALRELWFLEAQYGFNLRCEHIRSQDNKLADLLSRWDTSPRIASRFKYDLVDTVHLQEYTVQEELFDFQFKV